MSRILGVYVGTDRLAAVSIGDDGALVPVVLGDAGPTTSTAVGRSADGAMLVGDAAARAREVVRDPLERAVAGEASSLTAVVAHVIGRSVAATGNPPDRVVLVISDELDGVQRDRVVAAAVAAGAADVVAVPRAVAVAARPDSGDSGRPAELLLAAGAALTVQRMSAPIVTREDVDGPISVPPPVPPPSVDSGPPVSVFEPDEDEAPPVRGAAAVGAASTAPAPSTSPPTTALPTVGGGPAGRPPKMVPVPDRRVPVWAIVSFAVVLVALLAVVGLIVVTDDGESETTTDGATTTSRPTTTTGPSTSSSSSSSSSTSTTSSSTTSTSSTSTSTSSTTTVPRPVAEPGPVTLVETGLQLDTGTVIRFGQNGATVLDELAAVLGDPDDAGDWQATELCAGDQTRFVRWGRLEVVLEADADASDDEIDPDPDGEFVEWYVDGAKDPVGLVTRDGLGVGATIGFLEVNYGSTLEIAPAFDGAIEGVFAVANSATGGLIVGVTDGLRPDDTVQEMWAGDACQRTFL